MAKVAKELGLHQEFAEGRPEGLPRGNGHAARKHSGNGGRSGGKSFSKARSNGGGRGGQSKGFSKSYGSSGGGNRRRRSR